MQEAFLRKQRRLHGSTSRVWRRLSAGGQHALTHETFVRLRLQPLNRRRLDQSQQAMERKAESPSEGMAEASEAPASTHPFPSGLRVLVVDDDPLCLKVVGHMLRRCNYEGEAPPHH